MWAFAKLVVKDEELLEAVWRGAVRRIWEVNAEEPAETGTPVPVPGGLKGRYRAEALRENYAPGAKTRQTWRLGRVGHWEGMRS